MPKIHANGIDINYEVEGAGEPSLLISGFACDLNIWSKVGSPSRGNIR
jgi:3-oxoadipate enol-lactonase